jgi:hypothetical protein
MIRSSSRHVGVRKTGCLVPFSRRFTAVRPDLVVDVRENEPVGRRRRSSGRCRPAACVRRFPPPSTRNTAGRKPDRGPTRRNRLSSTAANGALAEIISSAGRSPSSHVPTSRDSPTCRVAMRLSQRNSCASGHSLHRRAVNQEKYLRGCKGSSHPRFGALPNGASPCPTVKL